MRVRAHKDLHDSRVLQYRIDRYIYKLYSTLGYLLQPCCSCAFLAAAFHLKLKPCELFSSVFVALCRTKLN